MSVIEKKNVQRSQKEIYVLENKSISMKRKEEMIVFISGSSKLKHLNEDMKKCLDDYMSKNVSFIVGDCYGADELAQKYLKSKGYEDVTVYCSTKKPREKRCSYDKFVSLWTESQCKTGEDFYQVKDAAMCKACDEAVAFWNGSSYGVKCNLIRCLDLNKPCKVYVSEIKDGDTTALNEVINHAAALKAQKSMPHLTTCLCGIPCSPFTGALRKFITSAKKNPMLQHGDMNWH